MVTAGTLSGKPALSTAGRVMLPACSPDWVTHPPITSSTTAGSIPVRPTSSSRTPAKRSAGWMSDSSPSGLPRPDGVRTTSTMTASARAMSHPERVRRQRVLGVQVLVDALRAALAPEPGLLPPAERCCRVRHDTDVEPHHSRLQPFDHALAAGEILGEDVRDQPVLGVVRQPHGLVLVREPDDGEHRPEDLLAQDLAACSDIGDDGGLEERSR